MEKKVYVNVRGLQILSLPSGEAGQDAPVEMTTCGFFRKVSGRCHVKYEEDLGGGNHVQTHVILSPGYAEIRRSGDLSAELLFEAGKTNTSWYRMPFGTLVLGITTRSVTLTEEKDRIEAVLLYELSIDRQHVADCMTTITVESASAAARREEEPADPASMLREFLAMGGDITEEE